MNNTASAQTPASPLASIRANDLCVSFGLDTARLGDRPMVTRRLSDLRGCFADTAAFDAALARGDDPLLYTVTAVEPAVGDGQLHYGLGILYPGRIGNEYYLTKGHLHTHRPAAEIYIGLSGDGAMLLEDEHNTDECRLAPLRAHTAIYVPGHTAHRTVNTGDKPLVYLGIYPANAGHDYGAIAEKNFAHVVVCGPDNRPTLQRR
ncbi:thermophilic glucose-6-phosphate isomerase-like enzyme [Opitutaceae bacterium TAV1]|nr:thermophilic glucose-6-phosphate isomerase-like enzyme [Opitutaceae bacterium TAV1]